MTQQRKIVVPSPENSETPLDGIHSWVTPTKFCFVRNHFDVPTIKAEQWRLSIEGCVSRPLTITYADLQNSPQRNLMATMECAGNGRSFLNPAAHGVQWGAGAIAHAEWTGVPLRVFLEKAGIQDDALEILCEGADQGHEGGSFIAFERALPMEKALHPDTLLCTHMNGEPLDANHGFPVRLLVPGWYGVASVKWIRRIEAINQPFEGYFQKKKYTIRERTEDGERTIGLTSMAIKSEFLRPNGGAELEVGSQRLFGAAWAGDQAVARVEVSTNGGESWQEAQLLGPTAPYSWSLWEYVWEVDAPGDYDLMCRATDANGQTQPMSHDPLRAGYVINFVRPRRVSVVDASQPVAVTDPETMLYDMTSFAETNAQFPLDVFMEYGDGGGI